MCQFKVIALVMGKEVIDKVFEAGDAGLAYLKARTELDKFIADLQDPDLDYKIIAVLDIEHARIVEKKT